MLISTDQKIDKVEEWVNTVESAQRDMQVTRPRNLDTNAVQSAQRLLSSSRYKALAARESLLCHEFCPHTHFTHAYSVPSFPSVAAASQASTASSVSLHTPGNI